MPNRFVRAAESRITNEKNALLYNKVYQREKANKKIVLTFKLLKIMKMEMYVAPELEVLEVMVEQGFAGSGEGDGEFENNKGWD